MGNVVDEKVPMLPTVITHYYDTVAVNLFNFASDFFFAVFARKKFSQK